MADITLYKEPSAAVTCISNLFIDKYMPRANGEYVKIYLYLLRCMAGKDTPLSLSRIADQFEHTENDVLRALRYWEKVRLLQLEYNAQQELSAIRLMEIPTDSSGHTTHDSDRQLADAAALTVPKASAPAVPVRKAPADTGTTNAFIQAAAPQAPAYPMDQIRTFCKRDQVRELIFVSEQYLGRTLNQKDLSMIFFWYDKLQLPEDLIEFLIESCVSRNHKSLHYMQRIAEDLASRNIRTVAAAQEYLNQNTESYHAVMKAFGIRNRNLIPAETRHLNRWSNEWGFSPDMISEACQRTIQTIHEPSFEYAASILDKWHQNGIHTLEDVKKADALYQQNRREQGQKDRTPAQASKPAANNKFINFNQRENDYEELQKKLILKSMQ